MRDISLLECESGPAEDVQALAFTTHRLDSASRGSALGPLTPTVLPREPLAPTALGDASLAARNLALNPVLGGPAHACVAVCGAEGACVGVEQGPALLTWLWLWLRCWCWLQLRRGTCSGGRAIILAEDCPFRKRRVQGLVNTAESVVDSSCHRLGLLWAVLCALRAEGGSSSISMVSSWVAEGRVLSGGRGSSEEGVEGGTHNHVLITPCVVV